jgi:hypothetical protein
VVVWWIGKVDVVKDVWGLVKLPTAKSIAAVAAKRSNISQGCPLAAKVF